MTEETIETTENTADETTQTVATKDRIVESATALVDALRDRLIGWLRTGIDVTAKGVETGSTHLSTLASRLQDYAGALPSAPAEEATNAEG